VNLRGESFVRVCRGAARAQARDFERAYLSALAIVAVARGAVALEEFARGDCRTRRLAVARRAGRGREREADGGEREFESFREAHPPTARSLLRVYILAETINRTPGRPQTGATINAQS